MELTLKTVKSFNFPSSPIFVHFIVQRDLSHFFFRKGLLNIWAEMLNLKIWSWKPFYFFIQFSQSEVPGISRYMALTL